jgi:hypothetical protein
MLLNSNFSNQGMLHIPKTAMQPSFKVTFGNAGVTLAAKVSLPTLLSKRIAGEL